MKLSAVKGRRTLSVIADVTEYIVGITSDTEAMELFKGAGQNAAHTIAAALPTLLRTHDDEIYGILEAISGNENYAEETALPDLINDVIELFTDDCFKELFSSAQSGNFGASSVSAQENTTAEAPEDLSDTV